MSYTLTRRAVIVCTAFFAMAGAAAAADTIKLGVVAPMSGPNARYGAFSLHGAELAVKHINAAGGINGKKIELFNADIPGSVAFRPTCPSMAGMSGTTSRQVFG